MSAKVMEKPSRASRLRIRCDPFWRRHFGLARLQQLATDPATGDIPHREILACIVAALEILGGLTIQRPRTARAGAIALGSIFLIFALLWIPRIVSEPLVYDRWGNFFEQFSQVAGAPIVYVMVNRSESEPAGRLARLGYIFFGICVVSFTLEQLFCLSGTAHFVPEWIPPGQTFWAITTTIAFGLAAIALLCDCGRSALLASRLLTVMLITFGLLVWLPAPFAEPHKLISWAGNAENLSITGAAWIVADFSREIAPPR